MRKFDLVDGKHGFIGAISRELVIIDVIGCAVMLDAVLFGRIDAFSSSRHAAAANPKDEWIVQYKLFQRACRCHGC